MVSHCDERPLASGQQFSSSQSSFAGQAAAIDSSHWQRYLGPTKRELAPTKRELGPRGAGGAREAQGGEDTPPGVVTGWFGGPGGDYRGGYLGSESQISEHQYLSDLEAQDLDTFGRLRP